MSDYNGGADVIEYIRSIGNLPLLKPEEEIAIAKARDEARKKLQMLVGDCNLISLESLLQNPDNRPEVADAYSRYIEIRNKLVIYNLRLVCDIAKRFRWSEAPPLDLIQAGNSGLIKAADKYDWKLGYKFSSYATPIIEQEVWEELTKFTALKVPRKLYSAASKARKAASKSNGENGHNALEQVSKETGISQETLAFLIKATKTSSALGSPQIITTPSTEDLDAKIDIQEIIDHELENTRPFDVLRLHYGFVREEDAKRINNAYRNRVINVEPGKRYLLRQIGEIMGFTKARAGQLENLAIAMLKSRHLKHSA